MTSVLSKERQREVLRQRGEDTQGGRCEEEAHVSVIWPQETNNCQTLNARIDRIEGKSDGCYVTTWEKNVPNTWLPLNPFYMEIVKLLFLHTF